MIRRSTLDVYIFCYLALVSERWLFVRKKILCFCTYFPALLKAYFQGKSRKNDRFTQALPFPREVMTENPKNIIILLHNEVSVV